MPDHPKPNVFAPEFLDRVGKRESQPVTTAEAAWAGPWRVEPHGEEFAVLRESGGEPEAVTEVRETALLLAAIFPVVGRDPLYRLERGEEARQVDDEDNADQEEPIEAFLQDGDDGRRGGALKTVLGPVGWLRALDEGVAEALSVAEYLLRSPTALAFLLEAAPVETLEQAGAILARRMLDGRNPETRPKEERTAP